MNHRAGRRRCGCRAGRRSAVPLVPSSSVTAVVTKSTGPSATTAVIVLGFSSGEENRMVSTSASSSDHPEGDRKLLDQVVGAVAALPLAVARRAPAVCDAGGSRRQSRLGSGLLRGGCGFAAAWSRSNGGTTPWRRTSSTCAPPARSPQRQQQHVVAVHLAEVGDVEERPDADRVEPVLGLGGDPLRVEVLLGDVAGQRRRDRRPGR